MKLDIPFYKQTTSLNCGPVALKMVIAYFGKHKEIEELETLTNIKKGKAVYTIQLAIAAASLGFKVDFYSKHISFNKEHFKHEFYKKYSEIDKEQSIKLLNEARKVGVNICQKTISQKELLGYVTKNSVPIILLDWNIIIDKKEKGYQGHFVPITGYDEQYIYVHNHGFNNAKAFMPIKRNIFDEARKSEGTDEDIIIIYRN